ncbi:nucleotide exchange factor GrpE [Candidatus Kaiserbacteria bacterium]|nr:nucleotide exchange factor GrpE [Candidatus Kaiserbacteria bacterium]
MDDSGEEFVAEEEAVAGPAALKSLREKLKKAVAEKQEYLEGWQRARADLVNYKKETAASFGEKEERIKAEFVKELMPALDVLELSVKHDDSPTLKMLERQFLDSLRKIGVERFGAVGEKFDHYKHEALIQKGDGDTIVTVERSGYSIGDSIIRPAQVII